VSGPEAGHGAQGFIEIWDAWLAPLQGGTVTSVGVGGAATILRPLLSTKATVTGAFGAGPQ
jgi:hypothetical protein